MLLSDLKSYLTRVRKANIITLAQHFNVDIERIRAMLQHWLNKGCVQRQLATANCGSKCVRCAPAQIEIYEWIG